MIYTSGPPAGEPELPGGEASTLASQLLGEMQAGSPEEKKQAADIAQENKKKEEKREDLQKEQEKCQKNCEKYEMDLKNQTKVNNGLTLPDAGNRPYKGTFSKLICVLFVDSLKSLKTP